MMRTSCVTGCVLLTFLTICDGIFWGSGKDCPDETFTCPCGPTGDSIKVTVPKCRYKFLFKEICVSCEDQEKEALCPKFSSCSVCSFDGNGCLLCPKGKYGKWCKKDCTCANGDDCEKDGKCTCQEGYSGRNCAVKKGCDPPPRGNPPLKVTYLPSDRPLLAFYFCPREYKLKGRSSNLCQQKTNTWSSGTPVCLAECSPLSAPANGRLSLSDKELMEGVTAEITCNRNYRLVGQDVLTCLAEGHWSDELPVCEKKISCPDPGNVLSAERTVLSGAAKGLGFIEDTIIEYNCLPGFEQLGENKISCRSDKTWSSKLPSCIRVSTIVPDCFTEGSEIISEEAVSVRIVCPPGCANKDLKVWGTFIYTEDSSVCQAAIHSAKITNRGGPVAVVNIGPYMDFSGSSFNNIESESYSEQYESFRFIELSPSVQSSDAEDCEEGLKRLGNLCVYVSNLLRTKSEAQAICTNIGLQLELPSDSEERTKLLEELKARRIQTIWTQTRSELSKPAKALEEYDYEHLCHVAIVAEMRLQEDRRNCNEFFHYVCIKQLGASYVAICQDPGSLTNGKVEPSGQIDDVYYAGSSIEYSCEPPYYLKGAKSISCSERGSWSDEKPVCIKAVGCKALPELTEGFVTYHEHLTNTKSRHSAAYQARTGRSRSERFPVGLSAPLPENLSESGVTSEPESVLLLPGVYRPGTKARYSCKSEYYKLIGNKIRRCSENGEWSGRRPVCKQICGRPDSPRLPFILDGKSTNVGQWPWQAFIAGYVQKFSRWDLACGGSLLNERWIITAAHCVTYNGTNVIKEANKFQVYLGKYHLYDSEDDHYVQVKKIQKIHIHPDYDPLLLESDIALLLLNSPVQFTPRVQPICLPTKQTARANLIEGKMGVITGWGINENRTFSEVLKQVVLPVLSNAKCEKEYEEIGLPQEIPDNMFCAGYADGRPDACIGDSGGPMVFTDGNSTERKWILEGIISWGVPDGCGKPKHYTGFTNVSKFLNWIHLYL